jgi:hypothetical protein
MAMYNVYELKEFSNGLLKQGTLAEYQQQS